MFVFCCDCFFDVFDVCCCLNCGSLWIVCYEEFYDFSIVYMDCDVFYVSVEKWDNLDLVDKLVIIGGGK